MEITLNNRQKKLFPHKPRSKTWGLKRMRDGKKYKRRWMNLQRFFLEDLKQNRKGKLGNSSDEATGYDGNVFVGRDAVGANLADRVSTFKKLKEEFMSKKEEKTEKIEVSETPVNTVTAQDERGPNPWYPPS